jgi:hypothetical protein
LFPARSHSCSHDRRQDFRFFLSLAPFAMCEVHT